jgi:hypothetical protein
MAESSKAAELRSGSFVGGWADRATAIITFAIAIVTSVGAAYQAAASLGSAIVRWGVVFVALCLCVGGLAFGAFDENTIVNPEGKPFKRRSKTKTLIFGTGTAFFATFLVTDIALNVSGLLSPIETNAPVFVGGADKILFSEQDGRRLRALPVGLAGYLIPTVDVGPIGGTTSRIFHGSSPEIVFAFRKRERIKELVIRDVTLHVRAFEEAPIPFRSPVAPSAIWVPETVLQFEIQKKLEQTPWRFKPIATKMGDKVQAGFTPIAVTDGFTNNMRIILRGASPGIYKVWVEFELAADFSAASSLRIPDQPVFLLFAAHSSDARTPKDGENVVIIRSGGRFETKPFEADNQMFPDSRPAYYSPSGTPSAPVPGAPARNIVAPSVAAPPADQDDPAPPAPPQK